MQYIVNAIQGRVESPLLGDVAHDDDLEVVNVWLDRGGFINLINQPFSADCAADTVAGLQGFDQRTEANDS